MFCNDGSDNITCLDNLKSIPTYHYLPFSNISTSSNKLMNQYKPIYCSQSVGDIIYFPSGWSHMTFNSQHTNNEDSNIVVGIGGQSIWNTFEREKQCNEILTNTSIDYECFKSLGNIYKQKSNEVKQIIINEYKNNVNKQNELNIERCKYLHNAEKMYR